MNEIIERHLFLEDSGRLRKFTDCDFNIESEFKKDKIKLPLSLKKIKDPYVILFYYNDTNRGILRKWKDLSVNTEVERNPNTDRIRFGFLNLNFERRILENFRNISVYSPYHWMKINNDDDRYFVVFYYQKYSQYYYKGAFNSTGMIVDFSDWEDKIIQKQVERSEKIKQFSESVINGNELFKSMKNFYLLKDSGERIQIDKGKTYRIRKIGDQRYTISEKVQSN